jgi:ABC-type transport system substrate-binding protein
MSSVDDRSFVLTLNKPFGLVEYILAGPGAPIAGIMREADAKRPDGVPLTNQIGSGPFRCVANSADDEPRMKPHRSRERRGRPQICSAIRLSY